MTALALASAKASPGVTTLALGLALAWPRHRGTPTLLVEADPDGGSLAARLGLGYEPGLVALAGAARRGLDAELLGAHAQPLAEGVSVVFGPAGAEQATAALATLAPRLAPALGGLPLDVVVDLGRCSPRTPALELARAARLVLMVARPSLEEAQHLPGRVAALRAAGCEVGVVCVGSGPYPPAEVAASAGAELVGVVADDARGAARLGVDPAGGGVRRSLLWRSTADLARALAARPGALRVAERAGSGA